MKANAWLLGGVAVVVVAGGYFALTEKRAIYECTACLDSDRQRCASSSDAPGARFEDDFAARAAAVENLCTALGEVDVAACARSPGKRFLTGCRSSLRRLPRPFLHME